MYECQIGATPTFFARIYQAITGKAPTVTAGTPAGTTPAVTPAPIVIPTGSVTVKVPESMAPKLELLPSSIDLSSPIVLAGIAALGVGLGFLAQRGK